MSLPLVTQKFIDMLEEKIKHGNNTINVKIRIARALLDHAEESPREVKIALLKYITDPKTADHVRQYVAKHRPEQLAILDKLLILI